jgi:hypothetical protein
MIIGPELWIRTFGIIGVGYGMFSVVLLIAAWLQPTPSMPTVSKYLSLVFLVALVVRLAIDVEKITDLEWLSAVLALILLWVNWFAVKRLADSTPYVP